MIILQSIEELLRFIRSSCLISNDIIAYKHPEQIIPFDIIRLIQTLLPMQQSIAIINGNAPRQSACIDLLLRGKSNKEIATELGLSIRTVEQYIAEVRIKLKAKSRLELVLKLLNKI